jgi:hypothetical protein
MGIRRCDIFLACATTERQRLQRKGTRENLRVVRPTFGIPDSDSLCSEEFHTAFSLPLSLMSFSLPVAVAGPDTRRRQVIVDTT